MRYQWPSQTQFKEWILVPEGRQCEICGGPRHICDHRHHRFFTLQGPVHLVSKLCRCADPRFAPVSTTAISIFVSISSALLNAALRTACACFRVMSAMA